MSALDKQEGGSHYKDMKIQPVEFIHANNVPFIEGCIIKYASRWRDKGGIADLRKIIHFAELLIELEGKENPTETIEQSVRRFFLSEKQSIGRALRGSPPWYPDDSGEWVEVEPSEKIPKGISKKDIVEILLISERDNQYYHSYKVAAGRANFEESVAYKKVNP